MTETTMTAKNLSRYLRQIGGRTINKTTGAVAEEGSNNELNTIIIAPKGVYIKFPTGDTRYDAIEMIHPTMYAVLARKAAPRRLMKGREIILVDTRDEPSEAVVIDKVVYQAMIDVVDSFAELAEEVARTTTDRYYRELTLLASQAARNFLSFYGMEPTQFTTEEEE